MTSGMSAEASGGPRARMARKSVKSAVIADSDDDAEALEAEAAEAEYLEGPTEKLAHKRSSLEMNFNIDWSALTSQAQQNDMQQSQSEEAQGHAAASESQPAGEGK